MSTKRFHTFILSMVLASAANLSFAGNDLTVVAAGNPASSHITENASNLQMSSVRRWYSGPVFASAAANGHVFFGTGGSVRVLQQKPSLSGPVPQQWQEIGAVKIEGVVRDMHTMGNSLYIADGSGALWIISIEEPAVPEILSKLPIKTEIKAISGDGNRVYLAAGWGASMWWT